MSARPWNVAVVGAGPAGCATAIALGRAGVERVCVIDPDQQSGWPIGETLPPDTRLVLDRLGLWDDFVAQGHEPCLGSCSAWGDDALGYNDFVLSLHGRGWHLDHHRFNALLRARAAAGGAAFIAGAKVLGAQPRPGPQYQLKLKQKDGRLADLTARYVVDATGSRAAFARRVGAQRIFFDRLAFVYGFFEAHAGASASRLTMTEAAQDGWWYAVGLPGRRVAVAFATEPETVRALGLSLEHRWFARALRTVHIAPRLDRCRFVPGSLVIRGAPSFLLDRVAGPRWLAVGDAAAAYDPLASQGIYKALEDGLAAADTIAIALASNSDIAPAYAGSIAAAFDDYRTNCDYFYRLETRWAASPFWRRRVKRAEQQTARPAA